MKKLILLLLIPFALSTIAMAQPATTTMTDYKFVVTKNGVKKSASQSVVESWVLSNVEHGKKICFRVTQTDSTNLAKTLVFTDLNDTLSYTLARTATGVATLTCTNGTPWTSNKTKVSFSNNQGTGKVYFSAAVTSTSVLTLYGYLQTSDAATDAGYGSSGTFLTAEVFD